MSVIAMLQCIKYFVLHTSTLTEVIYSATSKPARLQ